MKLYGYHKCSTCRDIEKKLQALAITYDYHDLKEKPLSEEVLRKLWETSHLPLKRFFNTSGQIYRERQLKEKLPQMTEEMQLKELTSAGMLVKRPILVTEEAVYVGSDVNKYLASIGG